MFCCFSEKQLSSDLKLLNIVLYIHCEISTSDQQIAQKMLKGGAQLLKIYLRNVDSQRLITEKEHSVTHNDIQSYACDHVLYLHVYISCISCIHSVLAFVHCRTGLITVGIYQCMYYTFEQCMLEFVLQFHYIYV